jgi:putative methionine-R-sulfoxide reductase with GAF domain
MVIMKIKDKKLLLEMARFAIELNEQKSLINGMLLISDKLKELVKVDRCSIYIYDKDNNLLWTTYSDKMKKIVIEANKGIAGKTVQTKKYQIINDINSSDDFYKAIDMQSGYHTEKIATVPIFDYNGEVIGVLQALNKIDGDFDLEDIALMSFFAKYITNFLQVIIVLEDELYIDDKLASLA